MSDGQRGWVDTKMLSPIGGNDYKTYLKSLPTAALVCVPMAYAVSENNRQTIPLTAGTRLTNYHNGRFEVLGVGFRIDPSMVLTQPRELNEQNLLTMVRFFLNVPYLWGGKNAMGMDCSGFTQTIMALFGRSLLRNASEQAKQGRAIAFRNVRAGDLVFFCHEPLSALSDKPHISHVGIAVDSNRVIHCSGRVKVEKLDETGIFSIELADKKHPQGQYSHYVISVRRL